MFRHLANLPDELASVISLALLEIYSGGTAPDFHGTSVSACASIRKGIVKKELSFGVIRIQNFVKPYNFGRNLNAKRLDLPHTSARHLDFRSTQKSRREKSSGLWVNRKLSAICHRAYLRARTYLLAKTGAIRKTTTRRPATSPKPRIRGTSPREVLSARAREAEPDAGRR